MRTLQSARPRRSTLSRPAPLVVILLLLAGACAPAATGARVSADQRIVTREEIADSRRPNLLSFLESHRPEWLRPRGADAYRPGQVLVYLDGMRIGEADALREISTDFAASLRYIDGIEATGRWGPGHGDGVIMVASITRDRLSGSDAPPRG